MDDTVENKKNLPAQIAKLAEYVAALKSIPTLLVIEDNQDDLFHFNSQLAECGNFKVISASSGESGIAELEHHRFDLIFLDLRMPGMDGVEVLKVLTEMRIKAPIVIMSGLANGPLVNSALAMGSAWMHLQKPIKADTLREMLKHVKL